MKPTRLNIFLLVTASILCLCPFLTAQDVQVNSKDSNQSNLGNYTTESETQVARSGQLVVSGYNSSRQVGLLGAASWNSLSGYAYSTNGGSSFTDAGFVPSTGTYILEGDPALAFDSAGNLYYASLLENPSAGGTYIGVNKSTSTSPTVTFGTPVVISGQFSTEAGSGAFEDKEFIAIDTTGGTYNNRIYVAWSEFPASGNPQVMLAASSSNSPLAFSTSIELAPSAASFQHGAFPAVAPDGSVYVAWSTLSSTGSAASATINLVKSTNGGASFGNPDPSDPSPTKVVASFTSTVGDLGTGGQSLRTRSFPYLAIDKTPAGSPTHGNMYVVFQGQPGTAASPRSEVFFTSSTDGGKTWLAPRNITSGLAATLGGDSTNNDNWMPFISVSPVTGHIKILLYSRREDSANQKIRVYEAGSTDGGMTFYNRAYSSVSFTPSVGYDPIINPTYMGDYLTAEADSHGLVGAWGDTRNLCAPPAGAASPCSPTGRGDQDVLAHTESDATGVDLAITPWGAVTGVGATWQSPDIFTVNGSGTVVNAEKGIVNLLRARIRNLGNAGATNAVVRFRYAPWYASIPDSAFKVIGTVNVNVPAGGAPQVVPINWDLTNLSDTNGGIWPAPISTFEHFCVRVDISYPSDINLSNNDAQSNFFDVSTGNGPIGPIHFILGNPAERAATLQVVHANFDPEVAKLIKAPVITIPNAHMATAMTMEPTAAEAQVNEVNMQARELRVGTIEIERPPASVTAHLTHDLVYNVNSVVDGKTVGGFSVLLARANVPTAPKPDGPLHIVSKQVETPKPAASQATAATTFSVRLAVPAAHKSVATALAQQDVRIAINDPVHNTVSSGAIPLSHEQLLAATPASAHGMVAEEDTGMYFVTVKTVQGASAATSTVSVAVRILVANPHDLDSPLAGRIIPSNGTLEKNLVGKLSVAMQAR